MWRVHDWVSFRERSGSGIQRLGCEVLGILNRGLIGLKQPQDVFELRPNRLHEQQHNRRARLLLSAFNAFDLGCACSGRLSHILASQMLRFAQESQIDPCGCEIPRLPWRTVVHMI